MMAPQKGTGPIPALSTSARTMSASRSIAMLRRCLSPSAVPLRQPSLAIDPFRMEKQSGLEVQTRIPGGLRRPSRVRSGGVFRYGVYPGEDPAVTESADDSYVLEYEWISQQRRLSRPLAARLSGGNLQLRSTATTYSPNHRCSDPWNHQNVELTTSGWPSLVPSGEPAPAAPALQATFFGTYLWANPIRRRPWRQVGGGMPSSAYRLS